MKAIVYERYGGPEVLQLRDVDKPLPKDDEVLVEVRATTVSSGDARLRAANFPEGFGVLARLALGVRAPRQRILGTELAGVVAAVGKNVTRFSVGDQIFAMPGMRLGAHAEYAVIRETGTIARKPSALAFEEAAALAFGGNTALDFFRRGKLAAGERILINGASGAVGIAAVQLAKHFGAHVTAVCSAANHELVRAHGADDVIDYASQDFTQNGETYDLIMDTVGTSPFVRCQRSLRPGGRMLLVLAGLPQILAAPRVHWTTDKRIIAGPASERAEDLRLLAQLAEQGKYRALIDRTYSLAAAAEAHAYVDTGRKRGSVVLKVA